MKPLSELEKEGFGEAEDSMTRNTDSVGSCVTEEANGLATMMKDTEDFEAFLDKLSPNRHRESAKAYSKINTEVRYWMGLQKGESITDFVQTFRWLFRAISKVWRIALPLRLLLARRRWMRQRLSQKEGMT